MSLLLQTQQAFTKNVGKLIVYIYANSYSATFADAYRSPEMAALYASQGKGIAHSQHCLRLAVDLNIFNEKNELLSTKADYQKFGDFWKSLPGNCRWGGDFEKLVDLDHFEMQEPK